jgi:hypothetical protein
MPPKQYEDILLLAEQTDSDSDSATSMIKPARFVRDVLKEPNLVLSQSSVEDESLVSRFHASSLRASGLLLTLDKVAGSSPTLGACKASLLTSFPMMLRQTSQLVDTLNRGNDEADRMVADIQSKFSLDCIDQYLDNIEQSMSLTDKDALDYQLGNIMRSLQSQVEKSEAYSCSVSTGITSRLVFDIGVGPVVTMELEKGPKCPLPLLAQVEPIVELTGDDLVHGLILPRHVTAHTVEIESLESCSGHFSSRSERTGEARIQLRVSPSVLAGNMDEWKGRQHGEEQCMEPLSIKEARV